MAGSSFCLTDADPLATDGHSTGSSVVYRCNLTATVRETLVRSVVTRRKEPSMTRRHVARVAGALLVSAALTGGFARPATAAADVPQPFTAHSGDVCRMGVAKGTIVWHLPPTNRSVDGQVTVVDRPDPNNPGPGCTDDGRYTTLVVTALAGRAPVDQQTVAVDNGARDARLALSAARPIETIVVQVCRSTRLPGPPTYCGAVQSFPAPVSTAG